MPLWMIGLVALALTGCIVDGGGGSAKTPRTTFDFSRLDSLDNPLARWYAIDKGRNLVGVKFAFTSMNYKHQVDSNIAAFASEIGAAPAIAGAYFDLSSQPKNLKAFLEAVAGNGCIPFVTLDPKDWDDADSVHQRTFTSLILSGGFDDTLKALAGTLRDFGKPVVFRFAHEMNGDWYPYCGIHLGGGADADRDGQPDGPQRYVEAWRHVHDLFAAAGAANLVWVFCPNAESFPGADWNRPFRYYPGADYVDLISVDSYESPDKSNRSLEAVLMEYMNEMGLFYESIGFGESAIPAKLAKLAEGGSAAVVKPFGLSEFGTYRNTGDAKAEWYASALGYISGSGRVQFGILYNASQRGRDYSIAGLGDRLKAALSSPGLLLGILAVRPSIAMERSP
jgi:beta-mannanase